jgi:hypothetical protein
MHRISGGPDMRPDNLVFLKIGIRPDSGFDGRISGRILQIAEYPAGYPANLLTVIMIIY